MQSCATRVGDSSPAQLATRFEQLTIALEEHLHEEETFILPIAQEHVTQEEWSRMGTRGVVHTPKAVRMLLLGLLLQDATPDRRAMFLGHIPAPIRLLYKLVGQRQYHAYVTRVTAGLAP